MSRGHVDVRLSISGAEVWVDDYELFDYLDDLMTERGLSYDSVWEERVAGKVYQVMSYSDPDVIARVSALVGEIPAEEIERIWRANNP